LKYVELLIDLCLEGVFDLLTTLMKSKKWIDALGNDYGLRIIRVALQQSDASYRGLSQLPFTSELVSNYDIQLARIKEFLRSLQLVQIQDFVYVLLESVVSDGFFQSLLASDTLMEIIRFLSPQSSLSTLSVLADLITDLPFACPAFGKLTRVLRHSISFVDHQILLEFRQRFNLFVTNPSNELAILWSSIQSEATVPSAVIPQHCSHILTWAIRLIAVDSTSILHENMVPAVFALISLYDMVP
jgi:hypothetical protein